MNKAFIFDMDGVIVDSENAWKEQESNLIVELFGPKIAEMIGDTTGISIDTIYEIAVKNGSKVDRKEYIKVYDERAFKVYARARMTPGIEPLLKKLKQFGFKIGLVSSSRLIWIESVLEKLESKASFELVLSLNERLDLQHKPHPDPYLEAMRVLGSLPETTIILEDSNPGIASAKASGALTLAFTANLLPGYQQKGADRYVATMEEVEKIVEEF